MHYVKELDYYYLNYFSQIEIANKFGDKGLPSEKEIKQHVLTAFIEPIVIIFNKGIQHEDKAVRRKYEWLRERLLSIQNLDFDWGELKMEKSKC